MKISQWAVSDAAFEALWDVANTDGRARQEQLS